MAASVTGTPTVYACGTANSGTASTTITVPSDCTYILCGITGFSSTANFFGSGATIQFTKGGADTAMTYIGGAASTSVFDGELFGIVAPDTGTNKTLKWDFSGAGASGDTALLSLLFLTGVHQTTPTRDVEFIATNPIRGNVTPSISASSGDFVVGFIGAFTPGVEDVCPTPVTNGTLIANLTRQGNADCAWFGQQATGAQTIGVGVGTNANWEDGAIVGVALIPAPAAAAGVGDAPKLQPKLWLKPWRFSHIQPTPPITSAAPYTLAADVGTLTLAGQNADVDYDRTLAAGLGTLTLGGQDVALRVARKTAAGLGTLTLAGQTVGLRATHAPLAAGTGTLTLAGQDATLRVTLPVSTGTLTLAGQAAALRTVRTAVAGLGTLTLGGQTVSLRVARKAVASTGTLTLSGQTVGLRATHVPLAAGLGTLTLSGRTVGLTYGRKMPAGTGTLTLSGQTATLKRTYVMPASNGILTLSGQTVTLRYARRPAAGLGTLTLAGQTVTLRYGHKAAAGLGTLTLAGQTVTLRYAHKLVAGTGTLVLSGQVVALAKTGVRVLTAGLGTLTLSGQTATLRYARKMTAGTGMLALSGQTVTLRRMRQLSATTGTLTLAGQPANLVYGAHVSYTLTASPGVLVLSGQAATLDLQRGAYVTPQPGRLTFGHSKVYVRRW